MTGSRLLTKRGGNRFNNRRAVSSLSPGPSNSRPITNVIAPLTLLSATVTHNLALGGGQGIGGGVYHLGVFSADPATVIVKNQASTGNDNVYP